MIAGALSTGTHGSVMESGAVQDFVKGLHLLDAESLRVFSSSFTDQCSLSD
jgi:hypothetical protein